MDTLVGKKEFIIPLRTCEYVLTLSLFVILVLSHTIFEPPLLANDLIANNAIKTSSMKEMTEFIKEEVNPQLRKDKFDERISQKYQGYTVNNVADGIKHIKMIRFYNGKPVRINVVEMNQQVAQNYELRPAIASITLPNRRTVRTIAQRTNSIVAVNGGFFKPQTGVPLGTLMINQKIYTGPIYDRVALGIFKDRYDVGRVQLNGRIIGNNQEIKIDNINQPRMLSSYILAYTRDWGKYAPASPQYGAQLRIEGNKITAASANPLSIPENGYVIVGPKSQISKLYGADYVDLQIETNPKWKKVQHIVSGGPYLLRNNEVFIDMSEERLQSIGGRNPRTAIGYTQDNDLILVAVDGREGSSVGLTLRELAYFMKSLGCTNAINLDGGGSTVMYVNGQIVSQPHQPGGIALSNAVVIAKKVEN